MISTGIIQNRQLRFMQNIAGKGLRTLSNLRVLIADDDDQVRRCLRRLLTQQRNIDIVGEAGSTAELLGAVRELRPDRVLVDVHMPDLGGLSLIGEIKEIDPSVVVVVHSVYADQLGDALRAGAGHFLLKGSTLEEMLRALHHPCCAVKSPPAELSVQAI